MYNARDLAAMALNDEDALWQIPDGPMKVVFDDGILETHGRATIFSAYSWPFYVLYPKTPALMCHHLGEKRVGGSTNLDLLGLVMWDCFDAYAPETPETHHVPFIEELCRRTYQAINLFYNVMTYRLESYVRTLSIYDFMEVINHAVIKQANDSVQPTQLSIDHCFRKIKGVILDPRELIGNSVADAAKNGMVSMGQILQCVGPRGFVTDVDSNIFREPILTGYAHGIRTLYGSMIESRSAAKALAFTDDPLKKTEYFNRRLQLIAATMQHLVPGDCGSQDYMTWRVSATDLATIAGKYYLTDKGLQRIKESDRHLIGERIQVRTPLSCKLPQSNSVCYRCFGELSLSVPADTNIGHVSATAVCEQASSRVLSVKHEDGSSTVDTIELSEYDQQFIRLGTDPNTIKLADRLEGRRVILLINGKEAEGISDVQYVENVTDLPVGFVSSLTEVHLTVIGKTKEEPVMIPVSVGSRHSSMTHELLAYIKQYGWTTTAPAPGSATGNYQIDLSHWDMELPLFVLPLKHMNMLDYMATIETFIKSSTQGGDSKTMRDFPTAEAALKEFYALVSSHLFVNIAHLEILVRAVMIRSEKHRDYRIPHHGNAVEFGSFNVTMAMRSLGSTMAFERHRFVFNDPATYLLDFRPDHPLDALLVDVSKPWGLPDSTT